MTQTQSLGYCQKCGKEWVIGDASVYGNRTGAQNRHANPPSLRCPFCNAERVRIKKERL